jgi:hypothetical protein
MIFDALTITGILSGVLSGGFVVATAFARPASRSEHWHHASTTPTRGRLKRRLPAVRVARAKHFGPQTAAAISA